jgi:hypothetical protein
MSKTSPFGIDRQIRVRCGMIGSHVPIDLAYLIPLFVLNGTLYIINGLIAESNE